MSRVCVLGHGLGFGLILLFSLRASAEGAAAGFPAESAPAGAKDATPPATDANAAPPATGAMPPDVPPPPPPAAEPAASTTPSAAASDAPFEPTPPPPRSHSVALGFRTGYSIPMGKIDGIAGDRMSNVFTGQVPISFELGWRAIPELVIGGYLGIAIGGVTGDIEKICDANGTDCMAISGRVGFELLYHFLPNGQADPWLGYGIGIEVASFSQKSSVREQTITFTGVELAHFMAGVDFPLSKSFSLGPFVDFALGRYTHVKDVIDDTTTLDADLSNRASHQWLTLGVRGMLLP